MTSNSTHSIILWDWNGTLLNDVEESIASMNELLQARDLPLLSESRYKEMFGFPVKKYYEKLGFDFESEVWEEVSAQFMQNYHNKEQNIKLFSTTIKALQHFHKLGKKQYILSAMQTKSIVKMLNNYGIASFFDNIYGLDNHYASGKIEVGQQLLAKEKLLPNDCIMIGDTTHDAEVANSLSTDCILISSGHQSKRRLSQCGTEVIKDLDTLIQKDI